MEAGMYNDRMGLSTQEPWQMHDLSDLTSSDEISSHKGSTISHQCAHWRPLTRAFGETIEDLNHNSTALHVFVICLGVRYW